MISSTITTINRTMDNNNINQIIPGDALTELKKLPDSFIDVAFRDVTTILESKMVWRRF